MPRTIIELHTALKHGTIPNDRPDLCIPCLYLEALRHDDLYGAFERWLLGIITHLPLRNRGRLPDDQDYKDTIQRHLGLCREELWAIAARPHPHVGWKARMDPKKRFWQVCSRAHAGRHGWHYRPIHQYLLHLNKRLLAEGRPMPHASVVFGR